MIETAINLKLACFIGIFGLFAACQPQGASNSSSNKVAIDSIPKKIIPPASVEQTSKVVLQLFKNNDLDGITQYIHPVKGVVFSPYGYIDTVHHLHFTLEAWKSFLSDTSKMHQWGRYDGSGDPIILKWNEYYERFIYEVDFLNAPQFASNRIISKSNSPNNINAVFAGSYFTESYFPGLDPQYNGLDWKALRLVFMLEEERYYLVAVVHDQWTI